jgi:hemolysin activation/secretion protein
MNGSAMRELQYLGFKTVEQVANASDEAKRKLGTLSKFIKLAQEWLAAANSTQNEVVKLKNQLEQEQIRTAKLENKVELLLQRISANEGTDLRDERKGVIQSIEIEDEPDLDAPRPRGRPRKV